MTTTAQRDHEAQTVGGLNDKLDADVRRKLWEHRKEYGRGGNVARDRWALRVLCDGGVISGAQFAAAEQLDSWNEQRRPGYTPPQQMERVEGGLPDYHGRFWSKEDADRRFHDYMNILHRHMRTPNQKDILWRAWDFPHATIQDLCYVYHYSGGNRDRVQATLVKCCELLEIHMLLNQEDCMRWNSRVALDQVYETAHGNDHRAQVRPCR